MPSHHATTSRSRLAAGVVLVLSLMVFTSGSLAGADSNEPVAAVVTEVAPTVPPTQAPPTQVPPTQVPPTAIPPTAVPPTQVPPTQVPPTQVPPTEVPPTEVPSPTPTPTQTPSAFPSTPSVPPVNRPPSPPPATSRPVEEVDISITCTPFSNQATPAVETGAWDLQLCSLPAPFATAASLDIRALSSDPGWRVILVDPSEAQAPGRLNASNNRAVIDHRPGQPDNTFLLGTQRTCSAIGSTTLLFALVGISGDTRSTATGTLDLVAPVTSPPTVTLQQVSISESSGTIEISYETSASPTCPWQISIALPGANDMQITDLTGPEGIAAATSPGVVVVTIPVGSDQAEIALTLLFPSSTPSQIALETLVYP